MIALLEHELVDKKGWIKKDEFLNMVGISESTPGPIAVNSATYIGYQIGGIQGSMIATFGVALPSFIIIYLISLFFDQFLELNYVMYAFKGIQVCVIYLIFTAGIKLLKSLEKNVFNSIILFVVMISMILCSIFSIKFSSVYYIFISGCIGVFIGRIVKMGEKL
ncbi:chromate transport protein [Lachnospiraceae bacterium TWA4]|nr:chromate transport protein [Lachnospiraceae bacterium TWA4]